MRNKKINFTNLLFSIAASSLILITVFTYQRVNKQAEASNWVSHTQLVKFKLKETVSYLFKAEAVQRGLLLTKDTIFFLEFYSSKNEIPKKLSELTTLISDNAQQVNNLKMVTGMLQLRIQYMQMVIDKTAGNVSAQLLDSLLLNGKTMTDTISRHIDLMIKTEDDLLAKRIESKQKEESATAAFTLLFSVCSIVILLFSFFRVKRQTSLLNVSAKTNEILEQKVQARTTELKMANDTLYSQNLDLQRKNEELNSFTFIANHDLKEPLRKIEMFVNKILHSGDSITEKSNAYLEKVISSIYRMRALLDAIFNYAQTERNLEFERVDLNEIAQLSLNTLQEIIEAKEAEIEYSNLPQIQAIALQMEQLFTNLISNSLKYSRKDVKPLIRIAAEKEIEIGGNDVWKITFTDNGIGFDEAYKEKIFERFQRLHGKTEYQGTGIGLAICKKILENHHGKIWANSSQGSGAVFTILIPIKSIT